MLFVIDNHGQVKAAIPEVYFGQQLNDEISQRWQSQLFNGSEQQPIQYWHNEAQLDTIVPIRIDQSVVGYARVLSNTAFIQQESARLLHNIGLYALIAVLVGGLITWLLLRGMVSQLSQLATAAQAITQGSLQVKLPKFNGHDEIATLGKAFELMIQSLKAQIKELSYQASHDSLTQLPNRAILVDRLHQAFERSQQTKHHVAIMFIDLDHFKTLNDTKGHSMGDLLLIEVANRLQTCMRGGDTLARLGGDEFVVILQDLNEDVSQAAIQAEVVAAKIISVVNQPYYLDSYLYHSSTSIGVCLFRNQEITVDELLKRADIAMYQAKNAGRNTLRFYDPTMQAALEARAALESDLRIAIKEQQFKLYYQIQVDHARNVHGAEALIRWQHPQKGLVPPLQFIPLSEETGQIIAIGQWVMDTACAQIKAWENDPMTCDLQIAVNVSACQFHDPGFVQQVSDMLKHHQIKPGRLKFELTESLVLDNVEEAVIKMQALRDFGVHFSIDDFGTGFSSLSYLTKLPLDQLKIDQTFIRNMCMNDRDAVVVQTIIGMANNLGIEVIAEGVELESQRAFLEKHHCNLCQGYLFSQPLPLAEFEAKLKNISVLM
ncbi:MAG: hypothetical protein B7X73_06980 [Methylophilales bacterium 39-45-7]|nr:MAG: hypothetical protein B7X73_06980 [Methylophilales bacterium 39-45-7]